MAIIAPSKSFEGSDLGNSDIGKYIREDIRQVRFNKTTNKDGAWLNFLPSYKLDSTGNGVWYKVVQIRDNFGDTLKDKYYVKAAETDPAVFFEKSFKRLFPEEAKVVDVEENGRKSKQYPPYGRIARRVIFNVVYTANLSAGVHVLDLPAYNGADQLDKWHKTKNANGSEKDLICRPDKCTPVFIKLNDGGGSPWQINPDPSQPMNMPVELCDLDLGYMYNLDNIFVEKSADEIVEKLRDMFTTDVFNRCLNGYRGHVTSVAMPTQVNTQLPQQATLPLSLPSLPSPVTAPASAVVSAVTLPRAEELAALPTNPMREAKQAGPATAAITKEQAMAFLRNEQQ